jgi:putative ABC transport system ATP-binding protein
MSSKQMSDRKVAYLEEVTKVYGEGRNSVRALDGVNLSVLSGEFIAVVGPSGSGKSTLLHILGCMDIPTTGTVEIDGEPVPRTNERKRTELRGEKIGFVFQSFHLLNELTVRENVELPRMFLRRSGEKKLAEIGELIDKVNMPRAVLDRRPSEISGGERQRVAIARALANDPSMLLCDEPTGNLDSANSDSVMKIFDGLNEEGVTIIVVTHNPSVADHASRIVTMRDGKLLGEVGE